MNWQIAEANNEVIREFSRAVRYINGERDLIPPYCTSHYCWDWFQLFPGTNTILLVPGDRSSSTPYGLIGEISGWDYFFPLYINSASGLTEFGIDYERCKDFYRIATWAIQERALIMADYRNLTLKIPEYLKNI